MEGSGVRVQGSEGGFWRAIRPRWIELVAGAAAAMLTTQCAIMTRGTLGTVMGALAVVTILLPLLVSGETTTRRRIELAWAVLSGAGAGLAVGAVQGDWGFGGWVRVFLVVAAYSTALASLSWLIERIRVAPSVAAGVTVLAGLLWLSWPIWMAPWLQSGEDEQLVSGLAKWHPILATNGALRELFPIPWAQERLAYRLTNIGDDVPYELPTSVRTCVAFHLFFALMITAADRMNARLKASRQVRHRVHPPVDEPDAQHRQ